jgi:O-antigen/teichoic acid export membrane protein
LYGIVVILAFVVNENQEFRTALLIFGGGMALHTFCLGLNVVYQAHGKLYIASLNGVLLVVVQAVFGVSLLALGGKLIALSLAYLIGVLIAILVNGLVFSRVIHPIRFRPVGAWREFAWKSLPVGLGASFRNISNRLGIVFLALLTDPFQTGIFSAAARLPVALANVPQGIFSAVLPAMAAHQNQAGPVRWLFKRSFLMMIALSVLLSVVLHQLAEPLVALIFGEDYSRSASTLRILAWSIIPVFIGMSFSHVVLSQHRLVRRMPWVTGIGLIVQILANLILVPRLQSTGAAISVLITELVLAVGFAVAAWRFLDIGSNPAGR